MNVAEGKGRFSRKEFIQFLYIARGPLFETITLMNIFKRENGLPTSNIMTFVIREMK